MKEEFKVIAQSEINILCGHIIWIRVTKLDYTTTHVKPIFQQAFSLSCVGKLNVHPTQIILPIFYMD